MRLRRLSHLCDGLNAGADGFDLFDLSWGFLEPTLKQVALAEGTKTLERVGQLLSEVFWLEGFVGLLQMEAWKKSPLALSVTGAAMALFLGMPQDLLCPQSSDIPNII